MIEVLGATPAENLDMIADSVALRPAGQARNQKGEPGKVEKGA